LARGARDRHSCSERQQHRREIRRMNDVRWTAADDRVVLVLALRGVTLRTTLLQADHFFETEIPAARALTQISTNGTEIANLRRGDRVCSFRQAGKALAHAGV